eukprot:scaffold676_cov115-Isochrysis_galbana.AAC.6
MEASATRHCTPKALGPGDYLETTAAPERRTVRRTNARRSSGAPRAEEGREATVAPMPRPHLLPPSPPAPRTAHSTQPSPESAFRPSRLAASNSCWPVCVRGQLPPSPALPPASHPPLPTPTLATLASNLPPRPGAPFRRRHCTCSRRMVSGTSSTVSAAT